ncbi:MAG: metallophosphoesterase [Sphaerochaeta sp.]
MRRGIPKIGSSFLLTILLISMLVLSGCSEIGGYSRIEQDAPGGSFDQSITSEEREDFNFLVLSDLHYGRENAGVYWAFEEFYTWLDAYQEKLDFAIHLGDGTSESKACEYESYAAFLGTLKDRGIPAHAILGNHDVRDQGREHFIQYIHPSTTRRFSHKGLSFYLLDSGNASLGKTQLDNLNEAIQEDPNVKVFCSHIPLYGGPEVFYFALSDPLERALLLETMVSNKVGLSLSGHLHIATKLYQFTPSNTELVCESFHGRDDFFESTRPVWYVLTYQADSHTITIVRYAVAKSGRIEEKEVATISMPLS